MRLPKQTRLRVLPYLTIIVTIFVLGLVLACAQRPRRVGHQTAITVKAGDDLQAAIDKANLGDTVIVQAGATFTGPLHLRDKGPGSGTGADYIMIRTSDLAGISPEGERVSPAKHVRGWSISNELQRLFEVVQPRFVITFVNISNADTEI